MRVPADDPPYTDDERTIECTRRQYLAGLVPAATAGIAGCSLGADTSDAAGNQLGPLSKRWEYPVDDPARPTFGDGGLYLAAKYGHAGVDRRVDVVALTSDGSERWRATTGDGNSAVGVGKDAVYVGSSDGGIYAFDAADGTRLFRYRYDSGEGIVPGSWLRPTPVDGVVVATVERSTADETGDHAVVGLDAVSGDRAWRRPIVDNGFTAPVVVDGAVVFGTDAGRIHAIDAASGDVRWCFETADGVRGPIVRDGDALFARSQDDHLHALGIDGNARWTGAFDNDVTAGPCVGGGVVFAGSADYTVRAFGVGSGDEAWRHEGRAPVTAMALSDGDTGGDGAALYVGTDEGEIRAHAADTGVVDWMGEFGEASNPIEWLATQNRRLYVGGHFGVEAYGTGGDGQ